ncbi:MAG: ABC transporter substrate-binding protein [Spirochaetes bacterium]|nr:ABC transporter substrate-binding protein [Spirochaetota bacterium]
MKNNSIKYFIILLLILVSCYGPAPEEKKQVVVRFWHPFSVDSSIGRTLMSMVSEFNKAHPGWVIKPEGMGSYDILKQKLIASIIAGNQPQISLAYESWINKFYKADKIVIFDEYVKNKKELRQIKNDLFPVFIKSCSMDGKLVSLPFNKSTPVLYYNKDMFKKYGISRAPRDWAEFLKIAKKLTMDKNTDGQVDVYGIIARANSTDFVDFLKQNNGSILSGDGKKVLFNRTEGIEALKFMLGWKFLYGIADFYSSGNPFEYQNDFTAGKCAMIIGTCVSRFYMKYSLTFRLGTAPLFGNKKKAVLIYGTNIVLFEKATDEQKKAAWEFIKWFISPENTARWSKNTAYLPVRKSALNSKFLQDEFRTDPELKSSILQLKDGFLEPSEDSWLLGRQYLSDALNDVLIDSQIEKAYKEYLKAGDTKDKKKLKSDLERIMEERIKYHLDKAAGKMERWVL